MINEKELLKTLYKLGAIEPDNVYAAKNKATLLAEIAKTPETPEVIVIKKTNWVFNHLPQLVGVTAVIALAVVISSLSSYNRSHNNVVTTSLDMSQLQKEYSALAIDIHLDNITYSEEIESTIAQAVQEIQDTPTKHLNPQIIESENNILNEIDYGPNKKIDQLLNEIVL